MFREPAESSQMPDVRPIRLRTVLVPLFGAALYYGVILAVTVFALVIFRESFYQYLKIIELVSMLLVTPVMIVWIYISEKTGGKKLLKRPLTPMISLTGITIALGLLGLTILYFLFVEEALSVFPVVRKSLEQYESMFEVGTLSSAEKIIFFISVTVMAPVSEELLFRGVILHEFLSAVKPAVAVFLSSAIFALFHVQPIQIGYAFLCGLVISVVYVLSKSIYLTILLHAVFNFFGSAIHILFPSLGKTGEYLSVLYMVSIALSVIAVIYIKKRNREITVAEDLDASASEG